MSATPKLKSASSFFTSNLFKDTQLASLFSDSKTFADAIARLPIKTIRDSYDAQKRNPNFDLQEFVHQNFLLPGDALQIKAPQIKESAHKKTDVLNNSNEQKLPKDSQIKEHIAALWQVLSREPDEATDSSLIALPHAYIVPGGRFREVYYWDTYFTAVGLALDGKFQLILNTFKNFQFLLQVNGCVPNGNRSYYKGRSQPPIMALLYNLLLENQQHLPEVATPEFMDSALLSLQAEYQFWMLGQETLHHSGDSYKRVVKMPDGSILNRYWDNEDGPRPESFKEDLELAQQLAVSDNVDPMFYRHIRAACESGWDFSSRWLKTADDLASIRTCDIVPVDLNCLLYFLEDTLARLCTTAGKSAQSVAYTQAAKARKKAIQSYFWCPKTHFFMDYSLEDASTTKIMSLAGIIPMFFNLAGEQQAKSIVNYMAEQFLKPGGLVTTLTHSSQQWDSPNGWAPLQWFAVIGLENYQQHSLARKVMSHWINNIEICFEQHRGLMEKYNVQDIGVTASGGEYQVQQGFGWTNGITRAFYHKLNISGKST